MLSTKKHVQTCLFVILMLSCIFFSHFSLNPSNTVKLLTYAATLWRLLAIYQFLRPYSIWLLSVLPKSAD